MKSSVKQEVIFFSQQRYDHPISREAEIDPEIPILSPANKGEDRGYHDFTYK